MRSQKDEISCLLGSNALDTWYRVSFCWKSDVSPSALYLGRSMQSPVLSSFVSFGCWMPRLSLVCWLSDILSSLLNLGLWYQSMQSPFGEIFELSSQPFLFLILLKPCEYCSYPLLRVGLKKRCSTLFRSQYRIMSLLTKESFSFCQSCENCSYPFLRVILRMGCATLFWTLVSPWLFLSAQCRFQWANWRW